MSGKCEICGRAPLSGNNVSHSNAKTPRRQNLNVNPHALFSEWLQKKCRADVCEKCMRTMSKPGNSVDVHLIRKEVARGIKKNGSNNLKSFQKQILKKHIENGIDSD